MQNKERYQLLQTKPADMKSFYFLFFLFFLSCNLFNKQGPYKIDFKKFSNDWDSLTSLALVDYSKLNNELAAKAVFIEKSLKDSSNKIDLLDRKAFLSVFKNKIISSNDSSVVIIELNQSGEKNSYRKYVIVNSASCYKLQKDINGNWRILNETKLSKESNSYISNIKTGDSENSSWGKGVNDICIITKINADSISIKPILALTKYSFDELVRRLN